MCSLSTTALKAQQTSDISKISTVQAFGTIDIADLEMKHCDFETDAAAMVLFDVGNTYYDDELHVVNERHKRIKIFNSNGGTEANIRLQFFTVNDYQKMDEIEAETINLVNGKAEITHIEKGLIYKEKVDKYETAYVFTFPNVKPGSVIEYRYKYTTLTRYAFPLWFFQGSIPVRYSELITSIPEIIKYHEKSHVTLPYALNTTDSSKRSFERASFNYTVKVMERAMVNVRSLPDEPYMSSKADNLQTLTFSLYAPLAAITWPQAGAALSVSPDFGDQFKVKLHNEGQILTQAKALKTEQAKTQYIFKQVQLAMKWNGRYRWYTDDGVAKAWDKKSGNSAEINLILYNLLVKAGVKNAFPMVVSTREHGKVEFSNPNLSQFNHAVVYVPVNDSADIILDATDKYNTYTDIPYNVLNSWGLYVDVDNMKFNTVFLRNRLPLRQITMVNAEITKEGKMSGDAKIVNNSYDRINNVRRYQTDGQQKMVDELKNGNNNLKITDLKLENLEVDTLPLNQTLSFNLELTASDGAYIYFNPAQFISIASNPFISEKRVSDIDLAYTRSFAMIGNYKIPTGYKTDAIPKNITVQMPDQSIVLRRTINEQDGTISVRYVIDHKKAIYPKENYTEFFDFYKKMHELLAEQIVLKRS
jgi:hypothetical protein